MFVRPTLDCILNINPCVWKFRKMFCYHKMSCFLFFIISWNISYINIQVNVRKKNRLILDRKCDLLPDFVTIVMFNLIMSRKHVNGILS
ncbi:hypothetical protein VNO77_41744 [Canavalia gladiata]|uniref:Uncharacterized protein n=1 Tax=Canavalia gladiata TaxID=3824 RepID=A0AAN9PS91_CANGL